MKTNDTGSQKLGSPSAGAADKLMEFARMDGVLAIRGLQAALIDAAIALGDAQTKATEWITCPATGEQCHDFCDPGKGDLCAVSGTFYNKRKGARKRGDRVLCPRCNSLLEERS